MTTSDDKPNDNNQDDKMVHLQDMNFLRGGGMLLLLMPSGLSSA
jgi:hypothetical protein